MNDKRIVEVAKDSFDILVVQGNLAVSAPQGLASWYALDKAFWIDPIAYAFAASPTYLMSEQKVRRGAEETERRYKRTFVKLADAYGGPFETALRESRALRPDDFDTVDLAQLVRRIIEWQRTIFQPPAEDTKYGLPTALEPALLTIPFFPLQARDATDAPPWLGLNIELIRAALNLGYEPNRLAAGVLVEPDLFDDDWSYFEGVLNAYLDLDVQHLWFWVSDNEETTMSLRRARRLRGVAHRVADRGRSMHQAFAGSFSTLLLREGVTSVAHGVNYWESKGWEPLAGGGLPTARYFYPPLRQRLQVVEVAAAFDPLVDTVEDFFRVVCGCPICREVVGDDVTNFGRFGEVQIRSRRTRWGTQAQYDVPTADALRLTKTHYLLAKGIEVGRTLQPDYSPVADLDRAADDHQSQFISTRHLATWRRALEDAPGGNGDG